ncbi:hypothetical protein K8R62_00130 [bacterium]|nr:hypothetical protein [bacterium]
MAFGGKGVPPAEHGFGAMPGVERQQEQCSCEEGGGHDHKDCACKEEGGGNCDNNCNCKNK